MKRFVVCLAFLGACLPDAPASQPTAEMSAHQRACVAKGENLISKDQMKGEPCEATALRLEALVRTDEDCKAFYGDAGITVSLCPPTREKPSRVYGVIKEDGGAE